MGKGILYGVCVSTVVFGSLMLFGIGIKVNESLDKFDVIKTDLKGIDTRIDGLEQAVRAMHD